MSTDSQQLKEYYELIVQKHASMVLCKECPAAAQYDSQLYCTHSNPLPTNCIVLSTQGVL